MLVSRFRRSNMGFSIPIEHLPVKTERKTFFFLKKHSVSHLREDILVLLLPEWEVTVQLIIFSCCYENSSNLAEKVADSVLSVWRFVTDSKRCQGFYLEVEKYFFHFLVIAGNHMNRGHHLSAICCRAHNHSHRLLKKKNTRDQPPTKPNRLQCLQCSPNALDNKFFISVKQLVHEIATNWGTCQLKDPRLQKSLFY